MYYPQLNETTISRDQTNVFAGYNHTLRIGDGEFYDMKNLSSTNYPVLSPRGVRGTYAEGDPQGMIAKDSLCYIDGSSFVMDEYKIDLGLTEGTKQLVSMGAYVIILPDKKYVNTADMSDYGDIEAVVTTTANVTFTLTRMDSSDYSVQYVQTSEPKNPANMTLWIDTSSEPHTLKQWSESSGMWVSIATTYVKIACPGIGKLFEEYDGISIDGLTGALHNADGAVISSEQLADLNGSAIVYDRGEDFITIVGLLDKATTISDSITISRVMPNMDFVIESNNRLWGCRYGTALNGEVVNEIYASKLGSFKNWNCFMGISTDSYVVSVGTDGQFTGAVTHLGYPIFFKENFLHKIYGNYPSAYQVQTTACKGVQKGSGASLAIVNSTLYYKGVDGVYGYDGSLPTLVSEAFGEERYTDAVAGAHALKYYISMKNDEGRCLFVYDAAKGLWHKEDDADITAFCSCRDEMYFIEGTKIRTMFGSGTLDTEDTEWMAESGIIGTDSPDKKYISRITIRMSLAIGTYIRLLAEYDSSGVWEELFTMTGNTLRTFAVPVRPKRCDHLRLRLEGQGEAKVFSLVKSVEEGSDT